MTLVPLYVETGENRIKKCLCVTSSKDGFCVIFFVYTYTFVEMCSES